MPSLLVLIALAPLAMAASDGAATTSFEAPKYGVKAVIPGDWPVQVREKGDLVFAALIPQDDPARPGVAACEIGLAPESLDAYRAQIESSARRTGERLTRNEVVHAPKGERLECVKEFRPSSGGVWHEVKVYRVAHRQLYTFVLNVDDATYARTRPAFDALVDSIKLAPPDTGADLFAPKANRWVQREFKFAIDLPDGWTPVLAPSEVALLFADGPAHGVWSDNLLVLAQPHRPLDLDALARDLPEQLRREEPACEVLTCAVRKVGGRDVLETVVRTRRGPFSMTVLEWRFRGSRLDYEVKYTLESKRFDALAPALRKSLESFGEVSGAPASLPRKKA
jgi:hypothetical protein